MSKKIKSETNLTERVLLDPLIKARLLMHKIGDDTFNDVIKILLDFYESKHPPIRVR